MKTENIIRQLKENKDWVPAFSTASFGKLYQNGSDWAIYLKDLKDKIPLSSKDKNLGVFYLII